MIRQLWNFLTAPFRHEKAETLPPPAEGRNVISMKFADDGAHKLWCASCNKTHVMLNIVCIGCLGFYVAPRSRTVQSKCDTIYRCPVCPA